MRKLLILVVVVALAGSGFYTWQHRTQWGLVGTTTTMVTTTTTAPVLAPLTDLVDPTGLSAHRAALTIKIENTPMARPQWGIDQADVVYEEIVEGGITRLAAIFNSHAPARVGPVRSVRRTDQALVWHVGGIFAFSGGAPYAIASINTAPVNIFSETRAGAGMFRDHTRYAPHNLYAVPPTLFSYGGSPTPPPSLFTYRTATSPVRGTRVSRFSVGFCCGYATSYIWNARHGSWDRSIFGAPDVTATHVQVSPTNVVAMWITYQGGVGRIGAEGILVGSGKASVFTNGREIDGMWSRANKTEAIIYRDAHGGVIRLTPGSTWVELLANPDVVTAVK